MGPSALFFHPKDDIKIFIALINQLPRLGLNTRTLVPLASTLTNTPPRRLHFAYYSDLSYYPSIYLKLLKKTTKNLSQDSRSQDRDLNPEHPEYEVVVLTTRPQRSMHLIVFTSSCNDCFR
jgi:hypothetical protein